MLKTSFSALMVLALGLAGFVTPVQAQDDDEDDRTWERRVPQREADEDDEHVRRFMFEFDENAFHLDDNLLQLPNFAMHFDPPDLSELEGLRFKFGEPKGIWWSRANGHSALRSEIQKLERESIELAQKARRADGSGREELETELRDTLEEIFDKKMELRRERIEALEEELREQREELRERDEVRDGMIDRRLNRLMGEDDALEW